MSARHPPILGRRLLDEETRALVPRALPGRRLHRATRRYRLSPDGQALEANVEPADLTDPARRARVESSAVEIHDDYKLLFAEFDDQGQSYSTASFKKLAEELQAEAQAPGQAPARHRALRPRLEEQRERLQPQRLLLPHVPVPGRRGHARRARAGPAAPSARPASSASSWAGAASRRRCRCSSSSRSTAASRPRPTSARGSSWSCCRSSTGTRRTSTPRRRNRCRLVILGHSFGGAMVFSAVANVLKSRLMESRVRTMLKGEEPHDRGVRRRRGPRQSRVRGLVVRAAERADDVLLSRSPAGRIR